MTFCQKPSKRQKKVHSTIVREFFLSGFGLQGGVFTNAPDGPGSGQDGLPDIHRNGSAGSVRADREQSGFDTLLYLVPAGDGFLQTQTTSVLFF